VLYFLDYRQPAGEETEEDKNCCVANTYFFGARSEQVAKNWTEARPPDTSMLPSNHDDKTTFI
jgi:hypothetical protein